MQRSGELNPCDAFQLFLNSGRDYAIFFMTPERRICKWSKAANLMLGYSEEEAVGKSGDVIFTVEDRSRGVPEQEAGTAVREGEANDERWHVTRTGARFFAVGRMVALKGQDGVLHGFAKIIRDATPQKLMEETLHATEAQLRASFSQAPWGIILADLRGRIQQTNAALTQMTGFTTQELVGKELIWLTYPDDRDKFLRQIDELFTEQRDTVTIEKRIQHADSTALWVQNSMTILRDPEGRPIGLLDLSQDITPLKLSEEELSRRVDERTAALQTKTAQLESFCYTIAHDLRAPLRAISGYAELLSGKQAEDNPAEAAQYLQRIRSSAERLDQLIRDLLGYTRAQQVSLEREEVDLTTLVAKAMEQLEHEMKIPDLRLQIEAPLGRIRSDPVALEHVIANLLSNALKFRRKDEALTIRVWSEQKPDRTRLWVEDNGIGIDDRYKDRVFQMFERVHPHLDIAGTGVGLAIVSTAVERLGGTRGVEHNQPHGSRFWIELPA